MLHTRLCDVLGVEHPVIQAGMGIFGSGAELAAAVSNAGGLGTVGGTGRALDDFERELRRAAELTSRPYAVNLTQPWLQENPAWFDAAVAARPKVISMALGDPGDLVARAHDAGSLFMQQVTTVEQARQVADRGVDIIIAQGTEGGGFTGRIAGIVLVPQVVDAVAPLPVVAAGGIVDGRSLAAALMLGAVGANIGTRFLASEEASVSPAWKQAIVEAGADDAVKAEVWDAIFPKPGGGAFDVVPRSLRTAFIDEWQARLDDARREAERLAGEIGTAIVENRMEEFVPFTGQAAGRIMDIRPAAEILRELVEAAAGALRGSSDIMG